MLEISEQPTKLLERRAPREGARSLAFVPFASANSRTFQQRSTHFAAAQSNSFRMTLLYKFQNNFPRDRRPGRILCGETLLESANSAENRSQKPAQNKSLRITSLYKRKNNCPGITLLQKKVGGGAVGALLRPLIELGELIYKRTEYIELDAPPRSGGQSGRASIRSVDGKI